MKKILFLFTALLFVGSMTVKADYFVAGTMNGWNAGSNDWKMSGSNPSSLTKQMASGTYQFKVTNGSWSWSTASFDNSLSNITLSSKDGNIQFTLSEESNVTFYYDGSKVYVQAVEVVVPSYTFTAGTTIYYDFTAYSTTGINTYVQGTEAWYGSTSSVIAITLTSDWKVTASTKLWRSGASGWNDYYCTTLPEDGQDMIVSTDGINYTWGTYGGGVLPPAAIKLHGNMKNPSWADTEEFTLASNEETASLTLTGITKGDYEFGVKIAESWTSNGSAFTRTNNSYEIAAGGSGNCTFNADRNGDYTFTWTYATNTLEITYPAIPAQSVALNSIASPMLKGTEVTFGATSSGIDEPGYRFYVKEKGGSYGSAVASYTFDAIGEYTVKVEALEYNTGDPVAFDEQDVVVYDAYTFHNGDVLYVDFSAMTEGTKGVNYPKTYEPYLDYDAAGAGTFKTITFTADVIWSTLADAFIKTEKANWAKLKFTVPEAGQNCAVVAADGLSYTWTTYVAPPPTIKMHGNFLGAWTNTDAFVIAAGYETASLTLNIQTKGEKEFGVRIGSDDNWTSNGASITRANSSAAIIAGEGNCKLNVDAKGDYTFTWTYATNTLSVTYPELPTQSVAFDGLASEIQKGTAINFADYVTSSGIDEPGYRFYVKEKGGSYGSAVASYTFDAIGEYTVKVEALEYNTGDPVASDEQDVAVYDAYTFHNGDVLYVDFSAMTEGTKGVNYPKTYEPYLDYDAAGAGTIKEVTFTADVIWSTLADAFIKTEKANWAELKFTVPGNGQNVVKVAADGTSYSWQAATYTVAGVEAVFGTNWDVTNTDNDMTLDEGVYKWQKTDITLPEGNVTFKVALNHDWALAWPAQNYDLVIAEAGIYTIDITFNPSTKIVAAQATKTGEAVVVNTAGILGSWDTWAVTEALIGEESASLTKHLEAGEYEFKIVVNGTDYRSNGYLYHRGYTSTEGITAEGENMRLTADIAGDYIFTWTFATNTISIEFPIIPIEQIGGKFIINQYGDTAVFSRGNLQYNYGTQTWSCAEKQYEVLGEAANLNFGNSEYSGSVDLFSWSSTNTNYGLINSYKDADFQNDNAFVDWGHVFDNVSDLSWSTLSANECNYLKAHNKWSLLILHPDDAADDEHFVMAFFPFDWVMPEGFNFSYGFYNLDDESAYDAHTFSYSQWNELQAAGAVLLPTTGSRAGLYGNTWNGSTDTGSEFNHVDLVDWYGYYWLSTPHPTDNNQAYFLILPGFSEGDPNTSEDDAWAAPAVWNREKRRGNAVRLITRIPRQYTVTYDANGAEGDVPTDENTYIAGALITVAGQGTLAKEGYRFVGWKLGESTYNENEQAETPKSVNDVVFEAQWEKDWQTVRENLTIDKYYTICLPKKVVEYQGATFWNMNKRGATMAYIEEVSGTELPAGTPYIFQATAETLQVIYEGAAVAAPVENGALRGTFAAMDQIALSAAATAAGSDIYLLSNNTLWNVTTTGASGNSLSAGRAYVLYEELEYVAAAPSSAPGKRVRGVSMNTNVATGMDALNASEQPMKMIIDGQLFIIRGEKMFDATGRLVK